MSQGELYLAVGPMFSGKTTWVQTEMQRLCKSRSKPLRYITVRFEVDNRTASDVILNHNGVAFNLKQDGQPIFTTVFKMLDMKFEEYDVIAIDELHIEILSKQQDMGKYHANHLEEQVYEFIYDLVYIKNKTVFISMNDYWHTGEVVSIYTKLQKIATEVKVKRAKCDRCGSRNATMSEKISEGDQLLCVSGEEDWIAVCARCWISRP